MEIKEAIKYINGVLSSEYHYDETLGYQLTSDDIEWLEMAKEALEKQIPKKPFDKSNNPEDWHIMCCPICKRVFWNSGDWVHYEPIICEKCGQHIDWSEQHPYRE